MYFFKSPPAFKPLPPPLPPRQSCSGAHNPQIQSAFLTKLPPEIRNDICRYAFSLNASECIAAKNHTLSLLLTCHKVNHEATNLAFYTYTFAIATHLEPTFISLRNKTSHLSAPQIFAITALSYDLGRKYTHRNIEVSNIITNGILTFPSLSRFEIYIQRGHKYEQEVHYSPMLTGRTFNDLHKDAIEKYAPIWFDDRILRPIANGHTFSWQSGDKWTVEWPQVDTPYLSVINSEDIHGELITKPYMGTEAIGAVRGVHLCVCGCDEVCWLSANLVQQTGRRLLIDTFFYSAEEGFKTSEEQYPHLKIRLRPGAQPLPVTEGPTGANAGTTSFGYEADEEYWDGIRRRNWKLDAIWKRFCMVNGKRKCEGERDEVVSTKQEDGTERVGVEIVDRSVVGVS
ncbi:Nn.00g011690.m01.CDS01 [Neocucurbitaria sp. VM-36]